MAPKSQKVEKTVKYPYPSRYGSHKSMVVKDSDDYNDTDYVVCKDEFGEYITSKNRLDNGLADPNRCASSRLTNLFVRVKEDKKA